MIGLRLQRDGLASTTTIHRESFMSQLFKNRSYKSSKHFYPFSCRLISDQPKFRIPRSEVDLAAPIIGMDKVICIGMNYKDHCEEQNAPVPTEPLVRS